MLGGELASGPLITLADGDAFNLAFIGIVASMFADFGVMYFIIFRRVWLVEDPLPLPGFEATEDARYCLRCKHWCGRARKRIVANNRYLDSNYHAWSF